MKHSNRFNAIILISYLSLMTIIFLFANEPVSANNNICTSYLQDSVSKSSINLPLCFEKNAGQFQDSYKFRLRSNNLNLFFYDNEVIYQIFRKTSDSSNQVTNIGLEFANASHNAIIVAEEPLSSTTNYFYGSNPDQWHANVKTSKTLIYKEIYNNIDIKYHSVRGKIKYDIIVHTGGNIKDVALHYKGIKNIKKTRTGKLIIETQYGSYTEDIPEAYQIKDGKKQYVKTSYTLINASTVGFTLSGDYDPTLELIIDPALIYSTYIGGSGNDYIYLGDMARDHQGNIYICGQTNSTNFPTTPGCFDNSLAGDYDAFVVKLNKYGTALIFSTYLGGSSLDQANSIALDTVTNEIYVAGTSESSNFPTTVGAYQTLHGGAYDIFVTKLNSSGTALIFSTYIGGSSSQEGLDMAVDNIGNIYIAGQTGNTLPVTLGAYQTTYGGSAFDAYLLKLNPAGTSLIFATYIGGGTIDRGCGVAVDNNYNCYLYGMTKGAFPTSAGAYQTVYGGGVNDVFITKFNPTGSAVIYSTYIGGSGDDWMRGAIAVDTKGQAYITGLCQNGFPVTSGAYDISYNGGSYDAFVTKLNTSGSSLLFSSYLGSTGDDRGYKLFLSPTKDIYVTGQAGTGFPVTSCAFDNTFNGSSTDAFISVFDSSGSLLKYSTYIGGSSNEVGNAILADGDTVYLTGYTQSSNFPVTTGCFDASYNSSNDIFVLKLPFQVGAISDFDCQPKACVGENITLTNNSHYATSYLWDFGNGDTSTTANPAISFSYPGTAIISLTTYGVCGNSTHSETIEILDCKPLVIYVPNVFSPNGDGANDVVYVHGQMVKEMTFIIYDRWGEKVFESTDINQGWDGTFRGKKMPQAVYAYYLKVAGANNSEIIKKGNISLVR